MTKMIDFETELRKIRNKKATQKVLECGWFILRE